MYSGIYMSTFFVLKTSYIKLCVCTRCYMNLCNILRITVVLPTAIPPVIAIFVALRNIIIDDKKKP